MASTAFEITSPAQEPRLRRREALLLGLDVELFTLGVELRPEASLDLGPLVACERPGNNLLLPVPHAEVAVVVLERATGHQDLAFPRDAKAEDAIPAHAGALVDDTLGDGRRR